MSQRLSWKLGSPLSPAGILRSGASASESSSAWETGRVRAGLGTLRLPCPCARRREGTRPPRNSDDSSAVRRFMPGGLLAGLAGVDSNRNEASVEPVLSGAHDTAF